jgi:hypothetical protein
LDRETFYSAESQHMHLDSFLFPRINHRDDKSVTEADPPGVSRSCAIQLSFRHGELRLSPLVIVKSGLRVWKALCCVISFLPGAVLSWQP